ncbi:MAG: cytochrome B [Burkholderiales bacterium PBB3]|nr:MAG: cytochrome B [Burkholderiales bacterium PBB3]
MSDSNQKILVWDLPVRVFHWLLAFSFTGAYLTAESERWRLIHVSLGYTFGGLIAFRLLWGIVGTRYARFSSFIRGPATVKEYLFAMFSQKPAHYIGHNPAGAVAIVLMLLSGIVIAATGWASYDNGGENWVAELHESAANFMLVVIGVHLAGVAVASRLHRENLVSAMLTGRKFGQPEQGIRLAWRSLGLVVLVLVLGFWCFQWLGAP